MLSQAHINAVGFRLIDRRTSLRPSTSSVATMEFRGTHSHSHEGGGSHTHSHSHGPGEHGHTHEIWPNAGSFVNREQPIQLGRNWSERAFTVGIGGYLCFTEEADLVLLDRVYFVLHDGLMCRENRFDVSTL
jgi:hypothetical protein